MNLRNIIVGYDLFSAKQVWKLILFVFGLLIVVVSLLLSNNFVNNIALQERQRVELWANAVKQRSQLVVDAERLFSSIKNQERKRVGHWASAYEKILNSLHQNIDDFYIEFMEDNTTIPMVITDKNSQRVFGSRNLDFAQDPPEFFDEELSDFFSVYPPILIPLQQYGDDDQLIYYQDSYIFTGLRQLISVITDSFISEVVVNSANVPVMLVDSLFQKIIASGNILISGEVDSVKLINFFVSKNTPFIIKLPEYGECHVLYDNSLLITQLKYYPFVTFFVIGIFVIVAYFLFSTSRNAEQNLVWVGMSKETAHQLGTPISSLMGWVEVLKEKGVDEKILVEIARDLDRMENVTQRFSKIGSQAKLEPVNIVEVTQRALDYMKTRISNRIIVKATYSANEIIVPLNKNLYEWVVENLCKNAVDAMDGKGTIKVEMFENPKNLTIDFSDTGKGIQASKFKTIFKPGYTSKQRGWGLGLSLSKRIIERYHRGKLFVKASELNKGTTFRMVLRKK